MRGTLDLAAPCQPSHMAHLSMTSSLMQKLIQHPAASSMSDGPGVLHSHRAAQAGGYPKQLKHTLRSKLDWIDKCFLALSVITHDPKDIGSPERNLSLAAIALSVLSIGGYLAPVGRKFSKLRGASNLPRPRYAQIPALPGFAE